MLRLLLSRIFHWLGVLLGASLAAFVLGQYSPTDPVANLTTLPDQLDSGYAEGAAARHAVRQRLGLDLPLFYLSLMADFEPDTLYRITEKDEHTCSRTWLFQTRKWQPIAEYRQAVQALWAAHSHFPLSDSLRAESWVRAQRLLTTSAIGEQAQLLADIQAIYPSKEILRCIACWQRLRDALTAHQKPFPLPKIVWYGSQNQYHHWLTGLLCGDWGRSYYTAQPVQERIGGRIGWTILFAVCALFSAYLLAVPMGVWMAARADSALDRRLNAGLFAIDAVPSIWMATLLLLLFANPDVLDWFPATFSAHSVHEQGFFMHIIHLLPHLVLPLICYTYGALAGIARLVRSRMIAEMGQDYIRTAWAKGASERRILWRHAFRNAATPLITAIGGTFPALVGGSLIVEQVFSIPGIAPEILAAAQSRDTPLLLAMVMLLAAATILGYAISDIWARKVLRHQ